MAIVIINSWDGMTLVIPTMKFLAVSTTLAIAMDRQARHLNIVAPRVLRN